jgi:hypothetical protein
LSVLATESQPFSYNFSGTTNPNSLSNFSYSVSGLPSGLNFDSLNGIISGIPTQNGTFNLPVTVSIPCGPTISSAVLVLVVNPAPPSSCPIQSMSSPANVSGEVKKSFSYTFTTTSTPTVSTLPNISISGALPNGLVFSPVNSTISGTPLDSGVFNLPVVITNSCGTSNGNLIININSEPSSEGGGGGSTPVIPVAPSGGGGGGGNTRLISNITFCQIDQGKVEISWSTNRPAVGRVLFGTTTVSYLTNKEFLGYVGGTEKGKELVLGHKFVIENLDLGKQYFARPMVSLSENSSFESSGDEVNFIVGAINPCRKVVEYEITASLPSCPFFERLHENRFK